MDGQPVLLSNYFHVCPTLSDVAGRAAEAAAQVSMQVAAYVLARFRADVGDTLLLLGLSRKYNAAAESFPC